MHLIDHFSPIISFTLLLLKKSPEELGLSMVDIHSEFLGLVESSSKSCSQSDCSAQYQDALFAVVAWVDEQMLCAEGKQHLEWRHFQLQRTIFNTTSAGDEFYQRLREIAENDKQMLEVYGYVMALGFRGNLYADPEAFQEVYSNTFALLDVDPDALLPEQLFPGAYDVEGTGKSWSGLRKWPSLFSMIVVVLPLLILTGFYFFCNYQLDNLYTSFK